MAVDEFGREIPGSKGRRDRSPSLDDYGSPSRTGDGAPSLLYEALPTSRHGDPSDRNATRKRKHRSDDSPPPGRRKTQDGEHHRKPHPSTLYAEEPMLCQVVWKERNPDESEEAYDEYRRSYSLNYVRCFFNQHMDDSWFRARYSPFARHRLALQERSRASQEASDFAAELDKSLGDNQQRGAMASSRSGGRCFFVLNARLGGGTKLGRHHDGYKGGHSSVSNPVPSTHVSRMASQVLPIEDVPPYVTEEQLTMAVLSHLGKDVKPSQLEIYSSSVPSTLASSTSVSNVGDMTRTCYLRCSEEISKELKQKLNHMARAAPAASAEGDDGKAKQQHVPRKEDTFMPKTLQLEVECSDPYGRMEYDVDGKGGAGEGEGGVPQRKATVWVSTVPMMPAVTVLSAAVSSKERIKKDYESARQLAKAYDTRRQIPEESQLDTLLPKAIEAIADNGDSMGDQDCEDALDLTIAYLRRVHLLSFYNGCTAASRVGDVFHGSHATSMIHLRLENADEILQQNERERQPTQPADSTPGEEEGDKETTPQVDLLVQRLNRSIEKCLEEANPWLEDPETWSNVVVSPEVDEEAKALEEEETQVESGWMDAHSLVDEDGKARCSFHFCRKLFKDMNFLRKHLIKKHSEFLRAEIAKCHDPHMMKVWDKEEQRPVPPVLVDCGRAFSLVPSPVLGASLPLAEDPEPELWRREEERQKAEEEEQARRERYQQQSDAPDLNGPLSEERPPPRHHSNFVDVDDMKEDKVEMAFDTVDIPVAPPKKKKKKKKLL